MSDSRPREIEIRHVETANQQKGHDRCEKNGQSRANLSAQGVFQEDEPETDLFVAILGASRCWMIVRSSVARARLMFGFRPAMT